LLVAAIAYAQLKHEFTQPRRIEISVFRHDCTLLGNRSPGEIVVGTQLRTLPDVSGVVAAVAQPSS
jgi:hypothetical protein